MLYNCRPPKAAGQRATVGLPSAPEPSRKAQMITIPAPAAANTLSSAKWAQRRQAPKDTSVTEVSSLPHVSCAFHKQPLWSMQHLCDRSLTQQLQHQLPCMTG